MGAAIVPIVILVLVLVVAAIVLKQLASRQEHRRSGLVEKRSALQYELPEGQDPAVVVAALNEEGYVVTLDERATGAPRVLIAGPEKRPDPDRERVRDVISGVRRINFEGDTATLPTPRFTDERA